MRMAVDQGLYFHTAANGTKVLNARQGGILKRIVVNTIGTTSTVTAFDNSAGSGTAIAIMSTVLQNYLEFNCSYSNGLTIVTAGAAPADITVVYV